MTAQRRWALVTGASSGLGVDFATQLAQAGWNLVITARRRDRLDALAERLTRDCGAQVIVIDGDLGVPGFRDALIAQATGGRQLQMVINNAGFGVQGAFVEVDWGRWSELMNLNMLALTHLSLEFARHMRAHGLPSHLVNVASVGAFQPVPSFAVYAATKSYVRDFSEALAIEQAGTNLAVTCVCPGGTRTEFMETAGLRLNKLVESSLQSSEACVREALGAVHRGKRLVVTGLLNKIMTFMTRLVPRWLSAVAAQRSMRPPS